VLQPYGFYIEKIITWHGIPGAELTELTPFGLKN